MPSMPSPHEQSPETKLEGAKGLPPGSPPRPPTRTTTGDASEFGEEPKDPENFSLLDSSLEALTVDESPPLNVDDVLGPPPTPTTEGTRDFDGKPIDLEGFSLHDSSLEGLRLDDGLRLEDSSLLSSDLNDPLLGGPEED